MNRRALSLVLLSVAVVESDTCALRLRSSPPAPLTGIMLDGDFGRSGKLTHHVAVIGNFSHNHASWGLHSTDTHTVLLQQQALRRR